MFLVFQLVGMSEKKNKREKKEGAWEETGASSLSLFFLFVYLFVCLFVSRLFFFSPDPTYRESETAITNIFEKSEEEHHH